MWYKSAQQLQLPGLDVMQNAPKEKEPKPTQEKPKDLLETEKPTRSLFFDEWAKDHYVPKYPVYHGTTHKFDIFDISKSDNENRLGAGFYFTNQQEDAEKNYLGKGPDQRVRIEKLMDMLSYENDNDMYYLFNLYNDDPRYSGYFNEDGTVKDLDELIEKIANDEILGPNEPHIIPAHVRMKNPLYLTRIYDPEHPRTEIDDDTDGYVEFDDADEENSTSLKTIILKLYNVLIDYMDSDEAYEISEDLSSSFKDAISFMKNLAELLNVYDENNDTNYKGEIIQRFLKSAGYDGIVMDPNLFFEGMYPKYGTKHFITWDSENIKHSRENIEFDPSKPSIKANSNWYKTALTTIDPTGQINFPDMGGHKFDLDQVKFKVDIFNTDKYRKYDISAFVPGFKERIGKFEFYYYKDDNYIEIVETLVNQPSLRKLDELQKAHGDDVEIKTTGIGIGNKLYEKFLDVIKSDPVLSNAKYIEGLVHSLQAYKAKNNAFGQPKYVKTQSLNHDLIKQLNNKRKELVNDIYLLPKGSDKEREKLAAEIDDIDYEIKKLSKLTDITHEEALKILEPATWAYHGGLDPKIFTKPNVETIHHIPEDPKIEKELREEDPNQLKLFSSNNYQKLAITKVDPSGQINMDFPGIKPKPFNIDKDVKFDVHYDSKFNEYQITAKLNNGRTLGFITFVARDFADEAHISMISLREYPTRKGEEYWEESANPDDRSKPEMLKELKDAGYDVDESSVSRLKWGLGKKLYEEAKKFLQNYKPDIRYITGYVHSKDAYEARNDVFGLPHHAYDPEGLERYKIDEKTKPEEKEEISKQISDYLMPARFEFTGHSDIPPGMYLVKHKINKIPYENTELYKQGPKLPKPLTGGLL